MRPEPRAGWTVGSCLVRSLSLVLYSHVSGRVPGSRQGPRTGVQRVNGHSQDEWMAMTFNIIPPHPCVRKSLGGIDLEYETIGMHLSTVELHTPTVTHTPLLVEPRCRYLQMGRTSTDNDMVSTKVRGTPLGTPVGTPWDTLPPPDLFGLVPFTSLSRPCMSWKTPGLRCALQTP